jgi:hypothetical protein
VVSSSNPSRQKKGRKEGKKEGGRKKLKFIHELGFRAKGVRESRVRQLNQEVLFPGSLTVDCGRFPTADPDTQCTYDIAHIAGRGLGRSVSTWGMERSGGGTSLGEEERHGSSLGEFKNSLLVLKVCLGKAKGPQERLVCGRKSGFVLSPGLQGRSQSQPMESGRITHRWWLFGV